MTDKVLENRLRRTLVRRGYSLWKSRQRDPKGTTFGRYMIVADGGRVVGGAGFTLALAEVERWLEEHT